MPKASSDFISVIGEVRSAVFSTTTFDAFDAGGDAHSVPRRHKEFVAGDSRRLGGGDLSGSGRSVAMVMAPSV